MYERPPEPTDLDELKQIKADALVDKLGISWAEAKERVGLTDDDEVAKSVRQQAMRAHPSSGSRRPYLVSRRPAVGEDSQDVVTGSISEKQAQINRQGIALVRGVFEADQTPLTSYDRALARAKQEKKERGR